MKKFTGYAGWTGSFGPHPVHPAYPVKKNIKIALRSFPYASEEEYEGLEREVKDFEPYKALVERPFPASFQEGNYYRTGQEKTVFTFFPVYEKNLQDMQDGVRRILSILHIL